MDAFNIFNIVLTDLVNDRLQLEEELERVINLNGNIPDKVNQIKVALDNLVKNDLMVNKWKTYLPITNEKNIEQDGKA